MNKFLEKYNLPKLNQEEIDNLNIPITSKESKTVKKKKKSSIEQNQTSGPDGLFTLVVTLDTWREQERERAQNGICLRKRVKMDGNNGFRRSVTGEGLCARQVEGRGFHGVVSMGKRSLGGYKSLWQFCGPQLTGSLHLFLLVICSRLFHKCSRALWLLSHFSHF